jgi:hypothetical protein
MKREMKMVGGQEHDKCSKVQRKLLLYFSEIQSQQKAPSAFGFFSKVLLTEFPHLHHPDAQCQLTSTSNGACDCQAVCSLA